MNLPLPLMHGTLQQVCIECPCFQGVWLRCFWDVILLLHCLLLMPWYKTALKTDLYDGMHRLAVYSNRLQHWVTQIMNTHHFSVSDLVAKRRSTRVMGISYGFCSQVVPRRFLALLLTWHKIVFISHQIFCCSVCNALCTLLALHD